MEKRMFDNESKSISSANTHEDKLDKLLLGQANMNTKLTNIEDKLENHERRIQEVEAMKNMIHKS